MKRWKKLFLALLVLVLLSQIPFAYRRYKLGRLHATIQQVNSQRQPKEESPFSEYTGVMHVHSFLGGHSSGNFEEIIAAAQSNQLHFVVMTEHPSKNFNTAEMTLKGPHGGVLFINGNEVRTRDGDRLLLIPGDEHAATDSERSTQEVLSRRSSGLALVAYPGEFRSWQATGYSGVEVYNVYTNALQINPLLMFFDGLWSYRSYPDLLFANFYQRPDENLQKWEDALKTTGGKAVVTAGNDAHANVGFNLKNESGKPLFGLQLDPYERSFRLVRLHVLLRNGEQLDAKSLMASIVAGHCFIGFDLFGDTSGFSFSASNGVEDKILGDEISLQKEVKLRVNTPIAGPGRIVLLKDGIKIRDEYGAGKTEYVVTEKGSYRVEVYLPQLGKPVGDQPWIISNPIYVR